MPTYTYQCDQCGRQLEEVRTVAKRNDLWHCGGPCELGVLRRVQETKAPGAAFKGTGWTPKSGGGRTA